LIKRLVTMNPNNFFLVDAFASDAFSGNPAAICIFNTPKDEKFMQKFAREINYSETAFLSILGKNKYSLRWFTPTKEIELCGHATLASAHVLWSSGSCELQNVIEFETLSGCLFARKTEQWIELEFPATPAETLTDIPPSIIKILGIKPVYVGKNATDYMVVLPSEDDVRQLAPDLKLIASLQSQGFIVTSRSQSEEYDFVSRVFAPNDGIDEDPVCGSAHCCLGPYWGSFLGKNQLHAYQASERGGVLRVKLLGNKVFLAGKAVTIVEGNLVV